MFGREAEHLGGNGHPTIDKTLAENTLVPLHACAQHLHKMIVCKSCSVFIIVGCLVGAYISW